MTKLLTPLETPGFVKNPATERRSIAVGSGPYARDRRIDGRMWTRRSARAGGRSDYAS
ncbi:hypothetical protein BN903_61 [Halorubrum sp. AJ67]|nr:hypothetical protein BN903_61 [Halorubrum sp. AJ67]